MTFDRNANLKAWREANPRKYWRQRQAEYAHRRALRAAGRAPGRCTCKAQGAEPHLAFCAKAAAPKAK